jgi:peptidyl-prolyl cis-trans isomerase C
MLDDMINSMFCRGDFKKMKSTKFLVNCALFRKYSYIHKTQRYALACALLLAVGFTHAESKEATKAEETANLAATVNGVAIETNALFPHVENSLHKYKKYGLQNQDEELIKALQMQALERLIDAELLYQEAKKVKVEDLSKRVTEKLDELIKKSEDTKKNFDKDKIRDILTKQILIDEYLTKSNLKNPHLPDAEIKKYYEANKEAFKRDETVSTRHILISLEADASSEDKENALDKIREARKHVIDGEAFEEVAKNYSDCNSASNGGELGYQPRGYMPQTYDDIAFSSDIGKLSNVIESEFGYHILEVLDHKSAGIPPYEEIKDFIGKFLNNQHQRKVMTDHLSALRKKAKIDIYL